MLLGESAPPRLSGMTWSTTQQTGLPRLFGVVGLARETLHLEAPEIARRVDHVVLDGPPRVTALARSALLAADLVLIPVQPSPYDVWASGEMVALVAEALVFRPMMRAAFVVNRRVIRTVIGREARATLTEHRIAPLAVEIHQRIVFAESVATGRLAFELDSVSTAGMPAARSGGGSPVRQRPRRQARHRAVAAPNSRSPETTLHTLHPLLRPPADRNGR